MQFNIWYGLLTTTTATTSNTVKSVYPKNVQTDGHIIKIKVKRIGMLITHVPSVFVRVRRTSNRVSMMMMIMVTTSVKTEQNADSSTLWSCEWWLVIINLRTSLVFTTSFKLIILLTRISNWMTHEGKNPSGIWTWSLFQARLAGAHWNYLAVCWCILFV